MEFLASLSFSIVSVYKLLIHPDKTLTMNSSGRSESKLGRRGAQRRKMNARRSWYRAGSIAKAIAERPQKMQHKVRWYDMIWRFHSQHAQAYTSKSCILIQVLSPSNAYTNMVIHIFILPNPFVVCSCMYASLLQWDLNVYTRHTIECLIAILRHNAYMHVQITKGFGIMNTCTSRFGICIGSRKYLNEYTPFQCMITEVKRCNLTLSLYETYPPHTHLHNSICL